jgi:hypothetical protein
MTLLLMRDGTLWAEYISNGEIQFKIVSFLLAHTKIYENPKDRYSTKPACSLAS